MDDRGGRGSDHQLQGVGVRATFVTVHGTGHSLSTPTEQPSPDHLADQVANFLEQTLR
ncbi:hypothetical protein ACQHIV_19155 [Kribbella sp. GL6]|uniref:hypothetical protein n=1 Tax=Kribbella sp. GL6 TaxID=3419765 RepID=UPI003CFE00F6